MNEQIAELLKASERVRKLEGSFNYLYLHRSKMKLPFLLLGTVLPLLPSAQTLQIPPAVAEDVQRRYPGIEVKDWDTTKDGGFKAELDVNEREHEVFYSAEGKWLWSDHDVKRSEVPQAVWDALAKTEYAEWNVDSKERLATTAHKELYEIKLKKKGSEDVYLFFFPDGSKASAPSRR